MMNEMYFMAIAAVVIMIAYLAYSIVLHRGVPTSISQTVYDMRNKWTWTAVLGIEAWLIAPVFVEQTSENTKFLAFLTVVAIGVLAVSPLWMKERNTLHNAATIVACVCSQLAIALNAPHLLYAWIVFALLLPFKTCRLRWKFIAGLTCTITVMAFCFLNGSVCP